MSSRTVRNNLQAHTDIIVSLLTKSIRTFYFLSLLRTNNQQGRGSNPGVGRGFSATFQTDPGADPASYTMDTGSSPGVKRPGRGVDHPPHLVPRLKGEYSYNSAPPLGLRGLL
jgi:hypothetical protein